MRRYTIRYPSGRTLVLDGTLELVPLGGPAGTVPIVMQGKHAVALDSRAVIFTEDVTVYAPRAHLATMGPALACWLRDNPAWAPNATEAFRGDTWR